MIETFLLYSNLIIRFSLYWYVGVNLGRIYDDYWERRRRQ